MQIKEHLVTDQLAMSATNITDNQPLVDADHSHLC